jgi:ribosome-binding ATPase YchF (GTP1/OBG family)
MSRSTAKRARAMPASSGSKKDYVVADGDVMHFRFAN